MDDLEQEASERDLDAALEAAEQGAAGRLLRSGGAAIQPRRGLARQLEVGLRSSMQAAVGTPTPGLMRRRELDWLKQMIWKTRSVSLTAILVTALTAALWALGADASPFRDSPGNRLVVQATTTSTTTGTTTTGATTTGTTTTGTTTTGTTTTDTTTGTSTTGTTTTGSSTSTSTTGTTTTGTTTSTTTSGTTSTTTSTSTTTTGTTSGTTTTAGPGGALPAQSNACDQKHPDTGNDTDGGEPGTPGHNNPKCTTTTTTTTASATTNAPVSPMPATSPGNGNGNGGNGQGGNGNGNNGGGNGGQGNGNGAGNGNGGNGGGNGNGGGKKP